jgi:hypothetical protein
VSGQLHALAALPRGKRPRYPLDKRLGESQSRSGRCGKGKILHRRELNPGRPACSYTDWAIPASLRYNNTHARAPLWRAEGSLFCHYACFLAKLVVVRNRSRRWQETLAIIMYVVMGYCHWTSLSRETCIREVHGSYLDRNNGYSDWGVSWFSSVPPKNARIVPRLGHEYEQTMAVINGSGRHSWMDGRLVSFSYRS